MSWPQLGSVDVKTLFAFAKERDWIYVVITLVVFAVPAFSLFGGQL